MQLLTMSDEELHIVCTDRDGVAHKLAALEGWRVMEIIRDHGLPIKAECGGSLECATCHVYVADNWLDKLVPKSDEEDEKLDEAFIVRRNSRLSCQILMRDDLDGLEVTLAPDGEN
jgi:ferredoxin, 2Fe-2S